MCPSSDQDEKKDTNVADEAFCQRIEYAVKKMGGAAEMARKTGLSRAVIDKYRNGLSDPSRTRLNLISHIAGVSVQWLANGEGEADRELEVALGMPGNYPGEHRQLMDIQQNAFKNGLFSVPLMNVPASAGDGAVVLNEATNGYIGFDAAWLRTAYNLNPNDLYAMPTVGESMEPTIKAGEFLLCSRSEHHIKPADGIYVIRLDGNILVKRLQLLPGGKIHVSSDNQAYKSFELKIGDAGTDFVILGKVVLVHGVRRL